MKTIIDQRGRLFGKINIIDFLVILFMVAILAAGSFAYKFLTEEPTITTEEKFIIEIETNCQFNGIEPEELKLISVGDKEQDTAGQVIGEILSLGESGPYVLEFNIGDGKTIVKEHVSLKQIVAKLKLKAEVKNNALYYKDKVLRIDSPLKFKTSKYTLSGAFIREGRELEERVIDLYVILRDLDKDAINKISVV